MDKRDMSRQSTARTTSEHLQENIRDLHYPTDKKGLLEMAEKEKAPEAIKEMIRKMPDKKYRDPKEIDRATGEEK